MAIGSILGSILELAKAHPIHTFSALLLSIFTVYVVGNEFVRARTRIKGLPGPRGLPLIGVLWDIRADAAEKYRKWSRTYGDVYQVQLGNIAVVVVNSAAAARSVFSHNAQALSSRPEFYTFHKIVSNTAGTTIGTSPYSDSLKRRRKAAAAALNRPSVAGYAGLFDLETREFVLETFEYGHAGRKAVDPLPILQRLSLSLSVTLNWGERVASQRHELFDEITHVEDEISRFRSTTGNLQDYVPLLRLNPFNSHSARAREMRNRRDAYLKTLDDGLAARMEAGTHEPCIQANVILEDREEGQRLTRAELTSISLTMLSGGLDTIINNVQWFIALLVRRPDVQDKAYAEIARFAAEQRERGLWEDGQLCDANDDQGCRYVAALVRESLRYFTVLRLALPRVSVRDIVHEGVMIPAGTVFFLNAWACNMDPKIWSDPEVFRPERWLEQPDAPMFTYGVGYRMCAGSLLANRELYLLYMRMLANFRVEPAPGEPTVDCDPLTGVVDTTSLVAMPRPFKALFRPRDPTVAEKWDRKVHGEKLK